MGKRQYPQMNRVVIQENGPKDVECAACVKPAVGWAVIEWSYMRGDDESEPVCQNHAGMAKGNFKQFMAHMSTKRAAAREVE